MYFMSSTAPKKFPKFLPFDLYPVRCRYVMSGNSFATASIGSMYPNDVPTMKLKPFRERLRKTCSESAPSGTFSMYAMWASGMFWQRYWRPSYWAWLQPPSSWGPIRTIATLNLPDSTSGIWRFAPPWVPVPAQAAEAAEPFAPPELFAAADPFAPADPFGAADPAVPLHAPNASAAIAKSDSSLTRVPTINDSSSPFVRHPRQR